MEQTRIEVDVQEENHEQQEDHKKIYRYKYIEYQNCWHE